MEPAIAADRHCAVIKASPVLFTGREIMLMACSPEFAPPPPMTDTRPSEEPTGAFHPSALSCRRLDVDLCGGIQVHWPIPPWPVIPRTDP